MHSIVQISTDKFEKAIYPVLVILVAALENAKPDSVNDMSLSQSIRFASAPAQHSGSQKSREELGVGNDIIGARSNREENGESIAEVARGAQEDLETV